MMISTKLSLQSLTLVLVVFTIFSVSLTENLQIADGFTAFSANLEYRIQVGETQLKTWKIINDDQNESLKLEMYATGQGSELFVFEENIVIEPGAIQEIEIFVIVPEDYPTDLELHPEVFAKKIKEYDAESSGAKINIGIQHVTKPIIFIGDNPVYYAPEIIEEVLPTPAPTNSNEPKTAPKVESIPGETMQEKLDRINNANLAKQGTPQVTTTDKPEVTDDVYLEEPKMDTEPVAEINAVDNLGEKEDEGGSCLIATAAYGTELAPQVQLLREIRDNQLMNTGIGTSFMTGFNTIYYSFAPTIADMERESSAFKELVKLSITPMISTLSVMEYADSEAEVLGLGIGVILMNLGMYVGLPTFGIVKLIQSRKN